MLADYVMCVCPSFGFVCALLWFCRLVKRQIASRGPGETRGKEETAEDTMRWCGVQVKDGVLKEGGC